MVNLQVGGQAVLGRQLQTATPWLTERHGYDPTSPTHDRLIVLNKKRQAVSICDVVILLKLISMASNQIFLSC